MAKLERQKKINLDKLDEGTRDFLLAVLLENRELRAAAEREHEELLFWSNRCKQLSDGTRGTEKQAAEYEDAFPNEYKGGEIK